jgi:superfamily II DNA or RNA helicase
MNENQIFEIPTLRPYQESLVADLRKELVRHRSVIACMPPGAGKTITAKHILGAYLNRPKREDESGRAAFMVHRRGLVENASNSFNEDPVLPHGVIMSGCDTHPGRKLQVASIDTKLSWYVNKEKYATDHTYDFLVFDEIHAQVQKFRSFLLAHNAKRKELGLPDPFVLGLSATPQHKELNKLFSKIVSGPTPSWLIENGYLSSFRYFQATQGKLGMLVKKGDEYTEDSVAKAMEGLAGDLVRDWKKFGEGRATIGFFPRRSQAQEAMELLRQNGVDAYYVDGETEDEERQKLFRHLNNGHIQYICNVGVIERGTDIPRVGCVQLCTAIGSVVRYRQMVGRGSRVHPAVSDCIVLDHANNIRKHGFFEDDIDWTLEWGERPAKTHEPRATMECPKCGSIYRGGKCKQCGYEPTPREMKSQGLDFVDGEMVEINKDSQPKEKKKTCEQIMIDALYQAGRRNGSFKQALAIAYQTANKQGTRFRVPATISIGEQVFKPVPYGHPDGSNRISQTYGIVVGNNSQECNPYRLSEKS